jgi:hypothetical protein
MWVLESSLVIIIIIKKILGGYLKVETEYIRVGFR